MAKTTYDQIACIAVEVLHVYLRRVGGYDACATVLLVALSASLRYVTPLSPICVQCNCSYLHCIRFSLAEMSVKHCAPLSGPFHQTGVSTIAHNCLADFRLSKALKMRRSADSLQISALPKTRQMGHLDKKANQEPLSRESRKY